ncbi:MAG: hypothetical protein A2882_04680 [Phenylobacterium sp. RIFCSPHIGHO2_01_FULL_70_10]|nr:MAG: hypothetical protein A2882_04680 [Phenylobacterium sp. RIFCSPHIGHO2_01_FULL_70_10]
MIRTILASLAAAVVLSGGAAAQTPMTERTEQLQLKPRRVPGLLGYGYDVGEYRGETSTRSSSFRALGTAISRDSARTKFTVESPNISPALQAECAGGQKRTQLGWISFEREDLSYVCSFTRNGQPVPGASFELALQKAGLLARMSQPQRAGEMTYGGRTIRLQTQRIGGVPLPTGRIAGYVFYKDGQEIGGVDFNRIMSPAIYLPPQGSPDRDVAALAALSILFFADPANQME